MDNRVKSKPTPPPAPPSGKTILDQPEFRAGLAKFFAERIPFCKTLGLAFSIEQRQAIARFKSAEPLLGNVKHNVLHGGVTAAVLDSIAGIAIYCRMAEVEPKGDAAEQMRDFGRISTIDLRVDYLEPANAAEYVATATVLRLGKRVANVQMTMHDDAGRCVAVGSAAFAIRARSKAGSV